MTTDITKQPCIKCKKGAGIIMCGGCKEWFCGKHFTEHRELLGEKIDRVVQQHDFLHNKLTEDNVTHPFYSCINEWENASIKKIQAIAKDAKTDLERYLNETKPQLRESLRKVKNELESRRESDDYTEMELKEWFNKLNKLEQLFEKPSSIDIVEYDRSKPLIRIIKEKSM